MEELKNSKETTKPILADELIAMLSKAYEVYGNRPIFVEINNKGFLINDLEFTAKGTDFKLIFK